MNVDGVINLTDLIIVSGQYNRTVSGCSWCNTSARGDDGPTSYFVGWYNAPNVVVGGVYATLLNYSPWVFPKIYNDGPDRDVAGPLLALGNLGLIAQDGWWAFPSGDQHTFYEWTTTSGGTYIVYSIAPEALGTSSTYTVLYNYVPGEFTFQVNGTTIGNQVATFPPNVGEIFGETHTLASQYPGGAFNPETISNSHIYVNGSWTDFNSPAALATPTAGAYGQATISSINPSTQINVWDTQCGF